MLKKIAQLAISIIIVSTLWFVGLETVYTRVLAFSSNVVLGIWGRNASIVVEKENGEYLFRVYTEFEGIKANYPQRVQSLFYPTIIVLSWQVFLAFAMGWRKSLRSGVKNLGLFFLFHILFLLLLTAYYSSSIARFFYDMMLESFYVIAVVVIAIDYIRHPVFAKSRDPEAG